MIQDIQPKHLNNQYENVLPKDDDKILIFGNRSIFLKKKNECIEYITYKEVKALLEEKVMLKDKENEEGLELYSEDFKYLLSIDEERYFLADIDEKQKKIIGKNTEYEYIKMFDLRAMHPKEKVYAGATGWHLYNWYKANRYCGCCGKKLIHDAKERMLRCGDCNNMVFPKISPAVIVGVTKGEYILMTKYADREYKRYALIAGFTEIGETAEETVAREVFEEVGLKIKNITYYKSQPWGFDSNLLLGYFAELDGDDSINLDETELSVGEWVHWSDISEDKEKLSLTADMMWKFRMDNEKK